MMLEMYLWFDCLRTEPVLHIPPPVMVQPCGDVRDVLMVRLSLYRLNRFWGNVNTPLMVMVQPGDDVKKLLMVRLSPYLLNLIWGDAHIPPPVMVQPVMMSGM